MASDDSDGMSSEPGLGQNQVSTVQSTSCAIQQYMMAAMLEIICSIQTGGDQHKTERLYRKVYKQLRSLGILRSLTTVREFAMVRHQFKQSFYSLILKITNDMQKESRSQFQPGTLTERVQIFLQPRLNSQLPALPPVEIFLPNRYRDEFEELEKIGKGAYGAVYKVKHKLDGRLYAMKRVRVPVQEERVHKVTREVRHLSSLEHRNVVRYSTAWIENDFPLSAQGDINDQETLMQNVPALEEPRALEHIKHTQGLDIDREQGDLDEMSDSVQFAGSSQGDAAAGGGGHFSHQSVSDPSILANGTSQVSVDGSMPEYPGQQKSNIPMSTLYIQMELCETNLRDWLKDRNDRHAKKECEVSVEDNLNILKQILKAVDYIHSKDLIHRDLKPHNVFINTRGSSMEIKLGDFGLSRHIQASPPVVDVNTTAASTSASASPEPLTPHPGIAEGFDWTLYTKGVGTPIYGAPEQREGNDYSNKSDMYSLGLIAYELYYPFHTESERRICLSKVRTDGLPQNFQRLWPKESQFIEKLLSVDHTARPSAKHLLSSALFLTKDQIIQNLCLEQDKLKAANLDLREELSKKLDLIERKDLEIERLKLQVLILDKTVRDTQRGLNTRDGNT